MTLDELNVFIEERDALYRASMEGKVSSRERVLARAVKLMEEVGELSDEVLGSLGFQRQEKLDAHTAEKMGAEAADVIITTFLLAKSLGVDLSDALEKKMAVIRERWK
ncbi:MAG: hypothetical protein KGI73_03310 [Patescibacteria group bacterium]|nr:hypothetical protein [Patescibacteria group bacterium]